MKHGWFSALQYQFGSSFYLRSDGQEVEVTHVSDTLDHGCMWVDMVYVGLVEKYLRKGYEPIEDENGLPLDWEVEPPIVRPTKLRFVNRIATYL